MFFIVDVDEKYCLILKNSDDTLMFKSFVENFRSMYGFRLSFFDD